MSAELKKFGRELSKRVDQAIKLGRFKNKADVARSIGFQHSSSLSMLLGGTSVSREAYANSVTLWPELGGLLDPAKLGSAGSRAPKMRTGKKASEKPVDAVIARSNGKNTNGKSELFTVTVTLGDRSEEVKKLLQGFVYMGLGKVPVEGLLRIYEGQITSA